MKDAAGKSEHLDVVVAGGRRRDPKELPHKNHNETIKLEIDTIPVSNGEKERERWYFIGGI